MEASTSPEIRVKAASASTLVTPAPATPSRLEAAWEIPKGAGIDLIQAGARAAQSCIAISAVQEDQSGLALAPLLPSLRERCAALSRFINTLNSNEPGAGRDIEIGRALLPLSILAMSQLKLETNAACLYDLYLRTHTDSQSGDPQISFPSWLLGTHNFLTVKPVTEKLPDATIYLEKSAELSGTLTGIYGRISNAEQELEKFQSLNEKSNAAAARNGHAPPNTYAAGISKWEGELAGVKAEIPALFNSLYDVLPEDVAESMNMLNIKAGLRKDLLAGYVRLTKDFEALLEGALCARPPEGVRISLPQVQEDGSLVTERYVFAQAELEALKADPHYLAQVVHSYLTCRAFLRSALPAIGNIPELKDSTPSIYEALRQPLTSERGKEALDILMLSPDPAVREAALCLLADPVTSREQKGAGWAHQLDDTRNLRPLLWAATSYVTSSGSDSENGFLQVLNESQELTQNLTPFLTKFKRAYEGGDFTRVAKILSDEIAAARQSRSFPKLLAPIAGLTVIARDKDASRRLKNQIPNVTDLKDIVPGVAAINESLTRETRALVDTAVKAVSVSMHDYYQDPKMEELWKFLSKFKLFLRHPNALDGLAGNEGMKSGILVAGKPGVGKSFFVKCLETELNIKSFTISPDQGERSAQKIMIDACRSIIEAAKKHASNVGPCILFIDEAEAVMADRGNPRVTNDQVELTCYLLQEINMIREKFPKILIVAATNYPDKIDDGMLRDGRFDIHVLMDLPPAPLREYIIRSTLAAEKIKLDLKPEELTRLVEVTDGMLPLPIKRTILETNRLGRLEAEEAGRPFTMTYDLLLGLYAAEKELKRFRLAERMNGKSEENPAKN